MSSSVVETDHPASANNPAPGIDGRDKNMVADDSLLVDEILTELNNDTRTSPGQLNTGPGGLSDNDMMMHPVNMMEPDQEVPPTMDVEYDSDEHATNGFMKKMKKPLIVLCLSFIVFNPAVLSLLEKNLPRVFSTAGGVLVQQGRVLLLSTLVALLYFATNCIV
jgi:hypothetical protein|tara:strand:- start:270 stop:761 length:492 start_codon:yes stop_codon:yes gene_type:complete